MPNNNGEMTEQEKMEFERETPDFVKDAEKEKAEKKQEPKGKAKGKTQAKATEKADKDEPVDIGEPEITTDSSEEKTPQEKSQAVTKALIKDKAINYFLESASGIINVMSRIDNEEGRRLIFFALNRSEIAMQEKGVVWAQINQRKLVSALANVALLGLDAEQQEIYPILYKDGKVTINNRSYDRYSIDMQKGYKGERKIRLKYAMRPIIDMDARLIREGDKFKVHTTAQSDTFEFDHDPFNEGKIKGAFGWVVREDGTMRVKVLTLNDIEKRKKASMDKMNGKLSPAWKNWYEEMALAKTILAAAKDIPIEIKDPVVAAAFRATEYENIEEVEIEDERNPRIPLNQDGKFRIGDGKDV